MTGFVKKKTLIRIFAVLLVCAGFAGALLAISRMLKVDTNASEVSVTTYTPSKREAPVFASNLSDNNESESGSDNKTYVMREDMELILIMGVDDRENAGETNTAINSSQADTLYVLALDHKNKTYKTLQINRDTMANVQTCTIEGKKYKVAKMQICLAHSYGKTDQARCLNTIDAVSGLIFDIPINHYVALNMSSIAVLNDQVGGVTLTMPAGLEAVNSRFKEGETVTLTGKQAEEFVRARMTLKDDHNSLRMERQELFLSAWKSQAKAKMNEDNGFALKLAVALTEYMTSDMNANSLSGLANKLKEYKDLGNITTSGQYLEADEKEERFYREFHVDMDDLKNKIIELCYEEKTTE